MHADTSPSRLLHAPASSGDHRRHLYEGRTLCRRTGWVAMSSDAVTCPGCRRRLERTVLAAAARDVGPAARAGWARAMFAFARPAHSLAPAAAE